MNEYVLAIDEGTTSVRAIVFDKNQSVVKVAQKSIQVFYPKPSWVEEDANEIWVATLSVIGQCFSDGEVKPTDIKAIGITNQRETTVVWDSETGLPIHHAIVWQSRQTNEIVEKYRPYQEMIQNKTGLILDPYYSASKIKFILDNVPNAKENKKLLFGTIDTWLLWRLTGGKVHATDVTNASRTMLFNIHEMKWDKELLDLFEIPEYILPSVKDTSGLYGTTDKTLFFNYECPITCLVGDQQGALFGESCFEKGEIKNTYGTGGFMLMNTGKEVIDSKNGLVSTVAWKIKDDLKYAVEGSIFVSGSLMQWLRDGLNIFTNVAESEAYANEVESSEGVIIVPAFTGLGAPYWNADCKGAIFGLTRGCNKKHLARAALEAMAYQSKDLVEVMKEDTKMPIDHLKVDGGAANNNFLLQFQSDILEMPVVKCENSESTALGAARLAGLEVGYYTYDDFANEKVKTYEPKMPTEEVKEKYKNWKKAVNACLEYK